MSLLTQAQAAFVIQQIEEAQAAKLDITRLQWSIRVDHPTRPVHSWISIDWQGSPSDRDYGTVSISHPWWTNEAPEVHTSIAIMRSAYGF